MKVQVWVLMTSLLLGSLAQADLTVYSDRPIARLQNAAQLFEAQTGQKVQFVEAAYGALLTRLQQEGPQTPADVIITKDLVFLADLKQKKMLQPMLTNLALMQVPAPMRDTENEWIGLTYRVRTLAYDPQRVNPASIKDYADLAKPEWMGKLCVRTGKAAYNEALVAHLLHVHGEVRTKEILQGWMKNLAAPLFPNDTSLLEAIANGVCEIGIVNHYYLAGLVASRPGFPVKLHFLDGGEGVHTNGTGAGVLATSKQQDLAQQFIEILLSKDIQLEMSSAHFDYPAVMGLAPTTLIQDWGSFRPSPLGWSEMGSKVEEARRVIQEAGYL